MKARRSKTAPQPARSGDRQRNLRASMALILRHRASLAVFRIALVFASLTIGLGAASTKASSHITCQMVRDYVARVGLSHAKRVAAAHNITASEKRRARRCLSTQM